MPHNYESPLRLNNRTSWKNAMTTIQRAVTRMILKREGDSIHLFFFGLGKIFFWLRKFWRLCRQIFEIFFCGSAMNLLICWTKAPFRRPMSRPFRKESQVWEDMDAQSDHLFHLWTAPLQMQLFYLWSNGCAHIVLLSPSLPFTDPRQQA